MNEPSIVAELLGLALLMGSLLIGRTLVDAYLYIQERRKQ